MTVDLSDGIASWETIADGAGSDVRSILAAIGAIDTTGSLQPTVPIKVTSPAGGVTPFTVKAAAGQSVNIQEWQSSAGAILARVEADGGFAYGSNVRVGLSADAGSGYPALGLQNATVVPTTNPGSGGVMFAYLGGLYWRGSSGTVTQLAAP